MARTEDISRATASADESPAIQSDGDWIIRTPGARERSWFLLHALLRGLFWLIPFAVAALLWIFWFEVPFRDPYPAGLFLVGVLILLGFLLWGITFPRKWRVAIGPREVFIDRGILWVTRVIVSYDRVQQIDVVSTPTMNRLDLTELVLHSAAGGVHIYALDPGDAALISDHVRESQTHVRLLLR